MRRRRPYLVVLLALVARPMAAQMVRGEVLARDSVPVAGAIVALVDSTGSEPSATLTDSVGHFELRAPRSGTYRLRVDAVGFVRVISVPFPLLAGERRNHRVHLTEATQRLSSLNIRERSRCDVKPTEGTKVALLWMEARKSLAASLLAQGRVPLLAYDQDVIDYDSAFNKVTAATRISLSARADEGYASTTPGSLRSLGYVQRLGMQDLYYGPDARVLLSDDFAATYCFNVEDRDPESERLVGLRFSPIERPRRGFTGITGTLWMDRETYALDRVEFTYSPRQSDEHPEGTFGGSAHFQRLRGGVVIIDRWELRTPVFQDIGDGRAGLREFSSDAARASSRQRLGAVRVAKGATREIGAEPAALPAVNALLRRGAPAPVCDAFVPDPARAELKGTVMDALGRAVAKARVRATWRQRLEGADSLVVHEQWAESGADANGRFILCGLPRGAELVVRATEGKAASPPSVVNLGALSFTPLVLRLP